MCIHVPDHFVDSQYSKDSSDATPLQETSQKPTSLASPTNNSELEHLRKKRLEKFSSTGSDKPDSLPKREASEQTVLRSVSTASSSSALSEETESYRRNVTSDSPPPVKDSKGSPPKRVEFEVGGLVKVEHKPKPWYGVIKWIGDLSGVPGTVAGVEMVWKSFKRSILYMCRYSLRIRLLDTFQQILLPFSLLVLLRFVL